MSEIIKLLPDHVANQIAAGEVVQRPASVVKELIENAVDAGAQSIQLILKDAGKTMIQVIDDGSGMSMLDARMAFERHATSKIAAAADLFKLHTKGFRGEALASIAAVSHCQVKTSRREDDLGTEIKIEGNKVTSQQPVVTPVGTMITVRNLFYNIPARRKFLKSDQVELRNITDEFHRVALVHPQSAMRLVHNDTQLFNLPAGTYRQRIVGIMGSRIEDKLIPLEEETELVRITGFIGKPDFTRKSKGLQFFFANNRFIKHSYLHHAVCNAYDGLLKDKALPSYFIYLDVPSDSLDINIHPTKTEVKFDDEHSLYAILRASVKHALGQFNVDQLDFNKAPEYEVPYDVATTTPDNPRINVNPDFNPFSPDHSGKHHAHHSKNLANNSSWENLYVDTNQPSQLIDETHLELDSANLFQSQNNENNSAIFQVQRKYLISTLKSGLLVINQHRAHQRILFERLVKQLTVQNGVSQQLLFPLSLSFTSDEILVLKEIKPALEHTGFIFKSMENDEVAIEGLPLELREQDVTSVLNNVIIHHKEELPEKENLRISVLAKSLAQGMAIKTGVVLQASQMQQLIDELFACDEPELTPDNKKIFINLTGDQLESKFN